MARVVLGAGAGRAVARCTGDNTHGVRTRVEVAAAFTGLIAYVVALRTREFGLRIALGADPKRIARWVVARGLALTAIGLAAGLVLFALAAPYLRASIFGIAPWEPLPLASAVVLLASAAALACWIPALRATTVDPAQALRAE